MPVREARQKSDVSDTPFATEIEAHARNTGHRPSCSHLPDRNHVAALWGFEPTPGVDGRTWSLRASCHTDLVRDPPQSS
jgi:hypothetical protein